MNSRNYVLSSPGERLLFKSPCFYCRCSLSCFCVAINAIIEYVVLVFISVILLETTPFEFSAVLFITTCEDIVLALEPLQFRSC